MKNKLNLILKRLIILANQIKCSYKGHEIEPFLLETEGYLCTTRCKKCKSILMGGFAWKIKHIPPPDSTPEQIIEWESYCENKYQELRESVLRQNHKQ